MEVEKAPVKKIFLIDDDPDDQEFFAMALAEINPGIELQTADNGVEAIKRLSASSDAPRIIFLDLNMPLMNGQQFLREMNKNDDLKRIPVIILSTSSDRQTIANTRELGAKDFITKPDKYSGWEETLRDVLTKPNAW